MAVPIPYLVTPCFSPAPSPYVSDPDNSKYTSIRVYVPRLGSIMDESTLTPRAAWNKLEAKP